MICDVEVGVHWCGKWWRTGVWDDVGVAWLGGAGMDPRPPRLPTRRARWAAQVEVREASCTTPTNTTTFADENARAGGDSSGEATLGKCWGQATSAGHLATIR